MIPLIILHIKVLSNIKKPVVYEIFYTLFWHILA